MRQRFCRMCRSWHEADDWPYSCLPEAAPRSGLPAPMIVSDTMEPTQSMIDGKMYTSKAALRATYQPSGNADGIRYTEVGNDPARFRPKPKRKPDMKAIRDTVSLAKARFDRGERTRDDLKFK